MAADILGQDVVVRVEHIRLSEFGLNDQSLRQAVLVLGVVRCMSSSSSEMASRQGKDRFLDLRMNRQLLACLRVFR